MANEELLAQIAALDGTGLLILLAVLLVLTIILVWPVYLVLKSKRVHGGKKLFWVIMMGTFSWLAYPPYLAMTRGDAEKSDASPGKA